MWWTRCSRLSLAVGPFVEDRRGGKRRMRSGSVPDCSTLLLGHRQAVVEAGQVERILDPHLGERRVVGEILDRQHDLAEVRGERLGQRGERCARAIASISSASGEGPKRRMATRHRGKRPRRGKVARAPRSLA